MRQETGLLKILGRKEAAGPAFGAMVGRDRVVVSREMIERASRERTR